MNYKRKGISRQLRTALAILMIVILGFAWLRTRPSGDTEHRLSPDTKWQAHVSRMTKATLMDGTSSYIEIRVSDTSTDANVYERVIQLGPNDSAPNYGDRSQRFIQWSTNSTQFTVVSKNGAIMTVHVPTAQRSKHE